MPKEDPSSLSEGLDKAYRDRGTWLRDVVARGGRDEAPDLVHDAVVKTLEAGQKADLREPLRFLVQVTRNVVVDRFRSRARRGRVVQVGLETTDAPDQAPSPERIVIATERLNQALAIIDRMPPRRREAFLLCRIEELTYAQAARRMGVTIHAVEKHMSAAMAQLFEEFDDG
jgi:RNA polymerase sigma-70 factor (ECF subfamily)